MEVEREEGELTDEDLEDVSDISALSEVPIQVVLSGKSPSLSANREPFRELSLTSVSDDDSEVGGSKYRLITTRSRELNYEVYRKHRHHREERKYSGTKRVRKLSEHRVVRRKPNNFHKEYSSVSSSSDESEYCKQDKKILRQLRDAVRINRTHNLPNCSLRTRLKRMIEPDSQGSKNSNSEEDNDLETLRDLALKSKKENDVSNVTDKDLIELRLKALQSAVLKKHQIRRRNKEEQQKKLQSQVEEVDNKEENAEEELCKVENVEINTNMVESIQENILNSTDKNSNITTNKINDITKTDEGISFVPVDLLSNEANKNITDNKNNINVEAENLDKNLKTNLEEDEAILRAMLLSNIYNNTADVAHSNQENIQTVTDKISSKDESYNKSENMKTNIDEDEDILRAMLLANISKKISDKKVVKQTNNLFNKNNTNLISSKRTIKKPSNTKNTVITPSVPVNRFIINLNSDSDSDCDQIVAERKLSERYPKSKDLFDQSLSLFLQEARQKSDADHKSDISHLPRSQQLEYKRLKRKLLQLTKNKSKNTVKMKKSLTRSDENSKLKLVNRNINRDKRIINASNITQVPKTPLKTILNDKHFNSKDDRLQEKGKYEELGPLMTRVSDARVARDKAQAEVKRLINDLRIARVELTTTHQTYTTLVQQLVTEKSLIDKRLNDDQKLKNKNTITPTICTSTPNKFVLNEIPREISCELSIINESVQSQSNILKEQPAELDNTITNKFTEKMEIEENPAQEEKKESFLIYDSPLEHIKINREQPESNPLSILCPYDLLGVCRDPDCSFRHCGNAITD